MRKLGIDYGKKRIGLALSDPLGIIASPLKTIINAGTGKTCDEIAAIATQNDVDLFVVGLPLELDGCEGAMAKQVRFFVSVLKKATNLNAVLIDERLTSHEASQILRESGIKGKMQKSVIDQASAQIILQTYLNSINPDSKKGD